MRPQNQHKQQKKYKQQNIKKYLKHKCLKCKCHHKFHHNNENIIMPTCCYNSQNICATCEKIISNDIDMGNSTSQDDDIKYSNVVTIDNNLNIIKCSKNFMTDVFPADVYVHKSGLINGGLGVFANKKFIKNEIIEIAPYIILENYSKEQNYGILKNYVFSINNTSNVALSLGFGSLYNCSKCPNVGFVIDNSLTRLMIFYAHSNIDKHEELYIDYGYDIDENMKNNINNTFPCDESTDFDEDNNNDDDIDEENEMYCILIKQTKKLIII